MEPRHVNAIMEGVQSIDSEDVHGIEDKDLQDAIDACDQALTLLHRERDSR